MKSKFEYRRVPYISGNKELIPKLEEMGKEGWELVSIVPVDHKNFSWERASYFVAYMKREIE